MLVYTSHTSFHRMVGLNTLPAETSLPFLTFRTLHWECRNRPEWRQQPTFPWGLEASTYLPKYLRLLSPSTAAAVLTMQKHRALTDKQLNFILVLHFLFYLPRPVLNQFLHDLSWSSSDTHWWHGVPLHHRTFWQDRQPTQSAVHHYPINRKR